MNTAAAPAAPSRPVDLGPLLAELDHLAEQATSLRLRLAQTGPVPGQRPGWPIRRVAATAADRA